MRLQIAGFGMLTAGMIVAWLIYLAMMPRQTPFIAFRVTQFASSLGIDPNSLAEEDMSRFREAFRERAGRSGGESTGNTNVGFWDHPRRADEVGNYPLDALLNGLLAPLDQPKLRAGGPRKNVLLFYISAHGTVDERGAPCLLVSDSQPFNSQTWLPVRDVLRALSEHPRFGSRKRIKKVVMLDANRWLAHDRTGLFYNDFATALERVVTEIGDPDLYVVNSTSPGEIAWSSPSLQGSVFGFFVAEGLNGYADKNQDGTIRLTEFSEYLRDAVGSWVRRRRGTSQTPKLITAEKQPQDVSLVHAPQRPTPLATAVASRQGEIEQQLRTRSRQLAELTREYQRLMAEQAYRRFPLQWGQLEFEIVQADGLLMAGATYDREYQRSLQRIQGLLKRLALPSGREGRSLPFQHATRPQLAQTTQTHLNTWRVKPVLAEWKEPLDHVEAVDLAWTWLSEGEAAAKLPTAVQLIEQNPPAGGPELVEAHFLTLLNRHTDRQAAAEAITRALAVREQAEEIAAMMDPRSLSWLEQELAALDQRRRQAEDALFLGTPEGLEKSQGELRALSDRYELVRQRAETLAAGYELRDEVYLLGPSLIRWAAWRSRAEKSPEALRDTAAMIDDLQALARALERTDQPDVELAWPNIAVIFQRLNVALSQAKELYYEHCTNLIETRAADQITLQSLWQALRLPTLDERVDRNRLRDRFLSLLLENQGDLVEADPARAARSDGDSSNPGVIDDESQLAALTAMGAHPLVRLLDRRSIRLPATSSPQPRPGPTLDTTGLSGSELRLARTSFLQQQGEILRESLAAVEAICFETTEQARRQFAGASADAEQETRRWLSGGDQMLRTSAGTLASALQLEWEKQPTTLLEWIDQRHVYLGLAARALDDFWGPIGAEGAYFQQAGDYYLELAGASARQVVPTLVANRYGDEDLTQLRQQRWDSARRGLLPITRGVTLHEGDALPAHEIDLSPLESLPPGQAYLSVRNPTADDKTLTLIREGSGGAEEIQRLPLRVAHQRVEPSHIAHQFRRRELPESSLNAVTFYRGHQWSSPLYITSPGFGQQVVVQRSPLSEPTVSVAGPDTRPLAIMLIFDCSYSMREKLTGDVSRTRLEVAQNAVPLMLERLPKANYRIGLTIYGHRAGTVRDAETNTRKPVYRDNTVHPELSGRAPLHPTEDVQVVLGLENELNARTIDRIRSMLNSLRPWGQTPLYYSIKRTAETELLRIDGNQFARRLIVITDGVNEQFQDSSTPRGVITERTDLEPLLRRMRAEDIRMDVFALDLLELKDDPRVIELQKMAAMTGGIYLDARTPAQLIDEISRVLRPGEFAIRDQAGGSATEPEFQSFGTIWRPDDWRNKKTEYVLSGRGVGREVRDHLFQLEGGEALDVRLEGADFVHRRYQPGEFFEEERTQDGAFYFRVPIPRRVSGSGVHFEVALQRHPESHFTPRPRHVWAEITPIGTRQDRDARSPMLAFYDLDFLPNRPVPVLQFRTTNWPEFASEAEMRLWFRMNDDIVPNEIFSVPTSNEPSRFSGASIPGIEFEIEVVSGRDGSGREVKVWEIHAPDAPVANLHTLRVQMEPEADEWSHRFIPDSRRVLHTFKYGGSSRPTRLLVTTRQRLTTGAQSLEKPIRLVLERR